MTKPLFISVIFTLCSFFSSAQDVTRLSYEDFIDIVKKHHPVSMQANLQVDKGEAYQMKAKGAFDPKLGGGLQQKYYDGKQYYHLLNAGLKIPTWFGITGSAGYDQTEGDFLNPQMYLPKQGLWHAGITVPIGKGLVIDQRRAELKQAEIFLNSTQMERKIILNTLILDASIAYWDWFKAYNKKLVYEEAVQNSETRLKGVLQSAKFGDKPELDTLKATIQLQNIKIKLQEASLDYLNKKVQLEVFLWQDGYVPLEVDDSTQAIALDDISVSPVVINETAFLDSLGNFHPKLIINANKIKQQEIEQKLMREQLKPELNVKYNFINEPQGADIFNNYSINNYTWGVELNFPIFLRKERANMKLAQIKTKELEADMAIKTAEISYKIKSAFNQWRNSVNQIDLYSQTVDNYKDLLDAEQSLFNIGEGSLFLVNSRERSYIDAQIKLIDYYAINKKAENYTEFNLMLMDE